MSRILCALSGIEFKCDHFSIYLTEREHYHPIFSVPTPELLKLADKYLDQRFSPTENYLYYLSLFATTELVEFRVPAAQTAHTQAIIAKNMEALLLMVERIHVAGHTRTQTTLNLPRFVISPDTKDLTSSGDWIKAWEHNWNDYKNNYKSSTTLDKLNRMEFLLERAIKDRTKDITAYVATLAKWAATAAEFPLDDAGLDSSILGGRRMSLSEFWQHIIRACARTESIFDIPEADIQELIEHCEEHIEHGSIFAHTLMALLRDGLSRKRSFINLGDIDLSAHGTVFRILDADTSVEDANKLALIDSAPLSKPIASDYPSKIAYLRAKMKWDMAESYRKSEETRNKIEEISQLAQAAAMNRRKDDAK